MRQLLGTLEWGIRASDAEVAQASLEALAALALCQQQALQAGGPGFPALTGTSLPGICMLRCSPLSMQGQRSEDKAALQHPCLPLLPLVLAQRPGAR